MRSTTLILAAAAVACTAPNLTLAHDRLARSGPYSLELVDEAGGSLPTFQHRGRLYVLGGRDQRYLMRIRNNSGRRIEVVASVDGRDVVDGTPASWDKRGYLVEPYGELTIDGYRLNQESVAAFRFSSVPESYAAKTGSTRDVGVVGVAVFPERRPPYVAPRPHYRPYPRDDYGYNYDEAPADKRSEAAPEESYGRLGGGLGMDSLGSKGPSESEAPTAKSRSAERPGLGTSFGEEHGSPVYNVQFERASSRPDSVLTLRYNDRRGLLALGIDVDGHRSRARDDTWMRETASPFPRSPGYAEPPPGWRP